MASNNNVNDNINQQPPGDNDSDISNIKGDDKESSVTAAGASISASDYESKTKQIIYSADEKEQQHYKAGMYSSYFYRIYIDR